MFIEVVVYNLVVVEIDVWVVYVFVICIDGFFDEFDIFVIEVIVVGDG